jgi:hypothetical protein
MKAGRQVLLALKLAQATRGDLNLQPLFRPASSQIKVPSLPEIISTWTARLPPFLILFKTSHSLGVVRKMIVAVSLALPDLYASEALLTGRRASRRRLPQTLKLGVVILSCRGGFQRLAEDGGRGAVPIQGSSDGCCVVKIFDLFWIRFFRGLDHLYASVFQRSRTELRGAQPLLGVLPSFGRW